MPLSAQASATRSCGKHNFGMLVAVITPYFKEPLEVLARCHRSVKEQTHPDTVHLMAADGHPRAEVDSWDVLHVSLPASGDSGDTPRAIAGLIAANCGAGAITLLDADNYFERDHIERLLDVQRATGVQVVTTTRMLIRTDGTRLGVCHESDGQTFNDTNCYLLMKPAFPVFSSWGFKDRRQGITGDRVFWKAIQSAGFTRAHCEKPTINYVTSYAHHYEERGERPPPDAKIIVRFSGESHDRLISYQDYVALLQQQPRPAAGHQNPGSDR